MVDKKKVIDDDGTIYYVSLEEHRSIPIDKIEHVFLYKKVEKEKIIKNTVSFFEKLKGKKESEYSEKYFTYEEIHQYDLPGLFRSINELSLSEIKKMINDAIIDYKLSNSNKNDFESWDGILTDDKTLKKKLSRDKKINDLLNGDMSKLEKFLDDER